MRFIGYKVGNRKFGCGQREKAYAYAKAIGAEVKTFTYKV